LTIYEDLKKQTFQDYNVIVVDDNSNIDEYKKISNITDRRLSLYPYPEPWKFGHDNEYNLGLNIALGKNAQFILILQTDMIISSDNLLEKLIDYMESNEKYGIVGPTITRNKNIVWGAGIDKIRMGLINNVSECYMLRAKCIREMGRVPNRLRYFGTEHYHKFWMKENGYYTASLSDVSVEHMGGGTSSKFQSYKNYYRPRTTIIIMRIFLKKIQVVTKLKMFYNEMYEIRLLMKNCIKRFKPFLLIKTITIFILGTFVGLTAKID